MGYVPIEWYTGHMLTIKAHDQNFWLSHRGPVFLSSLTQIAL